MECAAQRKDVDRLLLLAHSLVGDLVSKFQLALLLSKMGVDRKDGLVDDGIGFPGPAILGLMQEMRVNVLFILTDIVDTSFLRHLTHPARLLAMISSNSFLAVSDPVSR